MGEAIRIGVIGLGEAGSLIADGLVAAGAQVLGYDPAVQDHRTIPLAASVEAAVADAAVVISINSATVSQRVAEQVAPLLAPDAIYADLNTGTPALKRKLAALFAPGVFADVAIMQPVPGLAEKVPMAVAGEGAHRFIELLEPFGLNLEFVSEVPGEAAARKLLRSILAKGMASVLIDCLWAAESLGLQDWAYQEILREFDSSTSATAKRYLSGTAKHVKRRQIEMMDVTEMLAEIGYQPTMVDGVALTYSRILHSKKIPFSNLD
jgi:3-hydroxyisobutyrate dehydrogenase-like beta-hydroxyacid dehydrogenase